jgi:aerobic carbon-monoxide dehydrogenase large subunit
VQLVFTTTTPTTAYRGAGRPEAIYIIERLVDAAARETGRDRVELRRLNLIPKGALPYAAASGLTYDSGDFAAHLDQALEAADWSGFAARREASRQAGRLRGIGLTTYLEVTAAQGKEMGGIRFAADGTVTLVTGTLDYGQGHRAPFAQVLADRLGVPFEAIELLQGDSDQLLFGGGTGGSRSIMASGQAIEMAARLVVEQGKALAADRLEAATADIVFADGTFTVAGTDRRLALMDLARENPEALSAELVAETPPSAFPNGSHVAEVEIDPETGVVRLVRYVAVDDFGTMVNPLLVEGQVHGGLVQGIGQVLGENATYDADGQLLAGSFMDYVMPRADDVPSFELGFHSVPATTNALGAKGCGEAGVTAAPPTIMNAVLDALAPLGITDLDLPATPEKVWRAIRAAGGAHG